MGSVRDEGVLREEMELWEGGPAGRRQQASAQRPEDSPRNSHASAFDLELDFASFRIWCYGLQTPADRVCAWAAAWVASAAGRAGGV